MLTRDTIIQHLAQQLRPADELRAATLGGSDATGRADELSDVDLVVFVAPGLGREGVERAVQRIDDAIELLTPIHTRLRLPMPTWHGFDQAFYRLANAHEWTMLDWLIIPLDHPKREMFLEVERHGHHRILFDKDGIVIPAHLDRAALNTHLANRIIELRTRWEIFNHMGAKQARRGLPVDAAHFYQALVLRPLVDLLRILHAPERHDFGFRYLRDDLPAALYAEVCTLAYPRSADDLTAFTQRADTLFRQTLAEWDARPTHTATLVNLAAH